MKSVELLVPVTDANFDPAAYLRGNPDVAAAVESAPDPHQAAGEHWDTFGRTEQRTLTPADALDEINEMRRQKVARLRSAIRDDVPFVQRPSGALDFLDGDRRTAHPGLEPDFVPPISANRYGNQVEELIASTSDGLVLDCGAGYRSTYYEHVVNLEIEPYPTTDVLARGERLPFNDGTFDAVLSLAVLEHVAEPWRAAAEIERVLKPGGTLAFSATFMQPFHAYPHHYFNMTPAGARALLGALQLESQTVPPNLHPLHGVSRTLQTWLELLPESDQDDLLDLTVRDLLKPPAELWPRPFMQHIDADRIDEIAAGTFLVARKPT
ncbi:MAG: class I SAM-dependent methyltransferase [Acidimicrobiales bacterium]|nr:class I SAM-dependent methyltransferase [Acidimicrobiales bacterium]